MQSTSSPSKIPTPFALSGDKNAIPEAAAGLAAGVASFELGFPPVTRTPIATGGIPPLGRDMNGILYSLSQVARWAAAGGGYQFDPTFMADANVGGYPKGATLLKADLSGHWFNTVENNVTDPDSGGSVGWVDSLGAYLTVTAAATTYAPIHSQISAFVNDSGYLTVANFTGSMTTNGYLVMPGGWIFQWGEYTSDLPVPGGSAPSGVTISFPIPFPNACLNVSLTTRNPANDYLADAWPEFRARIASAFTMQPQSSGTGSPVLHGFLWTAIGR